MKEEELNYIEKTFETDDYITTTCMLVDDDGKVYYKWVSTESTKTSELGKLLKHNKFFKKFA